jgi:hypothetical protein
MKRLILFLFVINSMLFSQWEEVKIYPVKGDIVNFHLKDSLNLTAVIRAETSKVIKSTNGGRDWFSCKSWITRFRSGCNIFR